MQAEKGLIISAILYIMSNNTKTSDLIEVEVGSVDGLAECDAFAGEGEEVLDEGVSLEDLGLLH